MYEEKPEERLVILPMTDDNAKKISQTLANVTSRKILELLCKEPLSLTEISEKLEIGLPTLHYNIERLLESGLIKVKDIKYSKKGREIKIYEPTNKFIIITPVGEEKTRIFLKQALFAIYFLLSASFVGYIFQKLYYRFTYGIEPQFAIEAERAAKAPVMEEKAMIVRHIEPNIFIWFVFGALFALLLIFIWRKVNLMNLRKST
ncbi:MAG: ArsR/SmtB family transcription factor [Candidatus Hydrothermarchaeota archaeon]